MTGIMGILCNKLTKVLKKTRRWTLFMDTARISMKEKEQFVLLKLFLCGVQRSGMQELRGHNHAVFGEKIFKEHDDVRKYGTGHSF